MSGSVREFNKNDFSAAIGTGLIFVDFWAPWCHPCRLQGPIIEKLAVSLAGKATVGKVNVDENPELAAGYSVMNIPTIIIFKDGKEVKRLAGLRQEAELSALALTLA